MKLTAAQEMRLRNVTAADADWRRAKTEAHAVGKKAEEEYIATFAFERDRAIRLAVEEGTPKSQLLKKHQGLHTTAPVTLRDALARTAHMAAQIAAEQTDPLAERYSLDDAGHLVVTLTDEELEQVKQTVGYDDADGIAPNSATFTLGTHANGSDTLIPSEPTLFGTSWVRNPVAEWVWANESEALAWLAENAPEAVAA